MHREEGGILVLGETMSKLSILIPVRFGTDNNEYLTRTIKDLYTNAAGEIEVIVVLDGPCKGYKSLRYKGLTTQYNASKKLGIDHLRPPDGNARDIRLHLVPYGISRLPSACAQFGYRVSHLDERLYGLAHRVPD